MKTLSIDIETYSDVPLQKTGVYRYVESPNFEILLFAYSADNQPVQVIDLACGEQIPKEVLLALEDESVIKWAFNAAFERICLSRFLGYPTGEYLEPESWRCSMIWAATMGLPLSLEGVGAVLGLEKQKLSEGKALIKYFCQPCAPTKANGQRTRNRPFHAPDKWAMFKKYNIRDVETETGIQQRLSKFPVPAQVWDEYHQDQEINDRGVRLDMDLVATAIEMDTRSRTQLVDTMKEITQLENPNSVQQMKAWLVKAINQMLGDKSNYQAQLQLNIASVIRSSQATSVENIDEKLMALQQELIQKAQSKEAYDEIADEIFRLRELRQQTTVDTAARDEQIKRINDLQDYIAQQTTHLTEFDESLVRRWIKQITIWDDHITVELKSGVSIDVNA